MGISRRRIWVKAAASLATLTAVAGMTLASSPAFAASPVRAASHLRTSSAPARRHVMRIASISRPGIHTVRPARCPAAGRGDLRRATPARRMPCRMRSVETERFL